jgi:hypothetical protein
MTCASTSPLRPSFRKASTRVSPEMICHAMPPTLRTTIGSSSPSFSIDAAILAIASGVG